MTFLDSPPKPISRETFELSLASFASKAEQSWTTNDITNTNSNPNSGSSSSSSSNSIKDKLLKPRRRIAKPVRIVREVGSVVDDLAEVVAAVDKLVTDVANPCLLQQNDASGDGGGTGNDGGDGDSDRAAVVH